MTGRGTRLLFWGVLLVGLGVLFVRFGPSTLLALATAVTVVAGLAELRRLLHSNLPDSPERVGRTRVAVVAASAVGIVALVAASGLASGALDGRRKKGAPGGRPTPSPAAVGIDEYCRLSREYPSLEAPIDRGLTTGVLSRSDFDPLIANLDAAHAVAPLAVERDMGIILASYRELRDGLRPNIFENGTLAAVTIFSSLTRSAMSDVDKFDQEHCPG